MFSISKTMQSVILISLMVLLSAGLTACDNNEPPKLMKAVKQFKSDDFRDAHVKNMRKNHMDELLHKRDETMKQGIRTKKHSLKACINCHVPETYEGKALRHTDPEHFCATCHNYVAQQIDCFQCHVDHPNKQKVADALKDSIHENVKLEKPSDKHMPSTVVELKLTADQVKGVQ